jgi:fatty acid desaturase
MKRRDYSLLGDEAARANAAGMRSAEWYKSPVERKRLKELMKRSDRRATRDTILWFAVLLGFGTAGVLTWRSWWSLPIFFVYGTFYGSTADARWHECGHRTAFKTDWKNNVVYQIACFMLWREPEVWRWSHTQHHTNTIIVGLDPEIITSRPPRLGALLVDFFALKSGPIQFKGIVRHALGRISAQERIYLPESEMPKVTKVARIWLVLFAAVFALAVVTGSWLPLLLVLGPKFYGAWFQLFTGLTQHIGLAEDVLDHRLNCRTVYMNPLFRFMYLNMNYHLEHHQHPMVPYHQLPALHQEILADSPPPYPNTIVTYKEIISAFRRQMNDPMYYVQRPLPAPRPANGQGESR